MNKYIFSPIFALILGLANNLIVPFVGEVTGSFILIILTMPFWLSQIDQNDKIVKWALKLFLCLLLIQFITELFHDRNMILDKVKGIAVTITGMVHFSFSIPFIQKHQNNTMVCFRSYTVPIFISIRISTKLE